MSDRLEEINEYDREYMSGWIEPTTMSEAQLAQNPHVLLSELTAAQERADSLLFELDGLERMRLKDNAYLLERAERAEAERTALLDAAGELQFWEPGKRGYAEAHRKFYAVVAAVLAGRDSGALTEPGRATAGGFPSSSPQTPEVSAVRSAPGSVSAGRDSDD